eukprot:Nk52_evm2s1401 gene=Nk52_evmTU2s1401
MCGIFAYINFCVPVDRAKIIDILCNGLTRLEYRGYDSAGLAIDGPSGKPAVFKKTGKVRFLREECETSPLAKNELINSHVGIAHTRWATHGVPSERNCHPQLSDVSAEFSVVHNGIITNYKDVKTFLEHKGFEFTSDTDTEVIAKLSKYVYDENMKEVSANGGGEKKKLNFQQIVEQVISQLEGAFALVFKSIHYPDETVFTRRGSPLLVGIKAEEEQFNSEFVSVLYSEGRQRTQSGSHPDAHRKSVLKNASKGFHIEYFLASDASAIIEHTNRVIYLEDNDVAHINCGNLFIHRIKREENVSSVRSIHTLQMELQQIMKGSHDHFMQKEIFEQPDSVINTMRGRVDFKKKTVHLGGLVSNLQFLRTARRLMFIACGTSYHACIATRALLEEMSQVPVVVELASDFLDRSAPIFRDDACFFLSQSGETADTLNAMRYCKSKGALILGVTNTVGSSVSRDSDCGVHINAGPEIGVASTKAYTSQIIALVMVALQIAEDSVSKTERRHQIIDDLGRISGLISDVLKKDAEILELAKKIQNERSLLVMGRGYQHATCLEGALKIKELTYMHSEGILAGELKHGPLALIDENMPVMMLVMKDGTYDKCQNALEQVIARKGNPIIICSEEDRELLKKYKFQSFPVPKICDALICILAILPLQLLSYHLAVLRGCDVDFPRNLAKSVTVE